MKFDSVQIQNYRALKDVDLTFSEFTCIIGENNSGKSSTLLALSLFISGSNLNENDFYDLSKPIIIEAEISLCEDDLKKIKADENPKINYLITDFKLNLVRIYDSNGSSALFYKKLVPRDSRFNPEKIDEVLSGKKGKMIEESMKSHLLEYSHLFEGVTTKGDARKIIDSIIRSMKTEDLNESLVEIPSASLKIIQKICNYSAYPKSVD